MRKMSEDGSNFVEEKGIDVERVVIDEYKVADEFCCPICNSLLWKPRACASCQHLFCIGCIQTWLQTHPDSCPFRCIPYEEKRAPPYIKSLLSHLSIRCRNHLFGCTEILPYDRLETHETNECQYPTRQCRVCGEAILLDQLEDHQRICVSLTVVCSICKILVDRASYSEHLQTCFRERVNLLIDRIAPPPQIENVPTIDPVVPPPNPDNRSFFDRFNDRIERFLASMPKDELIGIDEVLRTRQGSYWRRVWTIFRMLLLNRSKAPAILLNLLCLSFGSLFGLQLCLAMIIKDQVRYATQRAFLLIILCSGLINFGLPILFTWVSDLWIIVFVVALTMLAVSIIPMIPLEYLSLRHTNQFAYVFITVILLFFKLFLLILRFYCWCIPSYIAAGCLAWIVMFISFHLRYW